MTETSSQQIYDTSSYSKKKQRKKIKVKLIHTHSEINLQLLLKQILNGTLLGTEEKGTDTN